MSVVLWMMSELGTPKIRVERLTARAGSQPRHRVRALGSKIVSMRVHYRSMYRRGKNPHRLELRFRTDRPHGMERLEV